MNFGVRFGQLVKRYREAQGLLAAELADLALGDKTKNTRLSELENGKVAKPHATTIDKLVLYLAIPADEVEACRHDPPDVEQDKQPLILENLALRFGIENPDASTDEKAAYLRDKARDYQAMQDRLAALGRAEANIANLIGAAQDALKAGDFDEADARLADAEDMQQAEKTLVEVRKQAAIRVQRGDALLLKDDAAAAAVHYEAAAAMFDAFEPGEGAQQRVAKLRDLYNHSLRFGGIGFAEGIALLRRSLEVWTQDNHPQEWGKAQGNLGLALWGQAAREEGAERTTLFAQAVTAYRASLEANTRQAHPVNWAATQNNLACTLSDQAEREEGAAEMALLAQAVIAFRAVLEVYTQEAHPVNWATTQNNLAVALWQQAASEDGPTGVAFLAQAETALRAALEVYTRKAHPVDWAMTKNNLGIALSKQAARKKSAARSALLGQAISAYRAALEVRTHQAHPVDWAATQYNLSLAFEDLATIEPDGTQRHLKQALEAVRLSEKVYRPDNFPVHTKDANALSERITAKLDALPAQSKGRKF